MHAGGETSVLREMELVARRVIASVAPLRVGVAESQADLDAMFQLRGAETIERGWAPAEAIPDGREQDEYDAAAVQIAIWDGSAVVGACRLVLPSPERLLPIEREFGLRLEPPGGVVEWGRLVLAERYRGDRRHRLTAACLAALLLETTRRGFGVCAGAAAKPILLMYEAMGFTFEVLGPPRWLHGEERYPARSSSATIRSGLEVLRRLTERGAPAGS